MFYRSAPVFMALSVALAGCGESDPSAAKKSGGSSANTQTSAGSTSATADPSASTEVCLTVEGMT